MPLSLPELMERLRERRQIDINQSIKLWRGCVSREYAGMLDSSEGWGFDSNKQQYIKPNGQPLSAEELRKVVHGFSSCVERKLRIVAGAGNMHRDHRWMIPLFLKFLLPLCLAMALLGVGGVKHFTAADSQVMNDNDEEWGTPFAIEHLINFAKEIDSGEYEGKEEACMRRGALYASTPWMLFAELRRIHAVAAGMKEEKSVLDPSTEQHCKSHESGANTKGVGCVDEARKGWRPIGTLKPIGSRICSFRCKCLMDYR